jgi:16S rRNA (uracil1498-N3)-methyltransferase
MARPPVANPLVFVDDLAAPVLGEDDDHHLRRVLRVRDGDEVTVADGRGAWRRAQFGRELTVLSAQVDEPVLAPEIAVAFAVVKGDRPEFIVQKLTELGADRIVPFVAARSVVRWDDDRAVRNIARLRKVAREAAMQCRRARLPVVETLVSFEDVISRPGAALADLDGTRPTLDRPLLVVGPEGGWTEQERAAAPARVSLSAHVLRAETAAITAAALLTSLRAGTVAPASEPAPADATG